MNDQVNHPEHYTSHPSGVECVEITEHMNYNLGNVFKYIWRADEKGAALQDLHKARFYLDREINRRIYTDPDRNVGAAPVQLELDLQPPEIGRVPTKRVDKPQKPVHRVVQCGSAKGRIVPKISQGG